MQTSALALPVIPLDEPAHLAARIRDACCAGPGFFYLSRHGLPQSAIDGIFALSRRFFVDDALRPGKEERDQEEKRRTTDRVGNTGYTAMCVHTHTLSSLSSAT